MSAFAARESWSWSTGAFFPALELSGPGLAGIVDETVGWLRGQREEETETICPSGVTMALISGVRLLRCVILECERGRGGVNGIDWSEYLD